MTPEDHSTSAGRPDLDLDEERDKVEEEQALVAGGLCRLEAPASPVGEDAD
jgi:hypothetical protein